jgi:CMP-N-acetylneuraminic acid synthetase
MIGPPQVNHYGFPPRMIAIVPTRDGYKSPSRRMADKSTRLMLGKTLDEWAMIQLRCCKYVDTIIFVCETMEHSMRLSPLAMDYDVKLMVRPQDMLHPINDTGGLPVLWAAQEAFKTDWWSFITTPFNCTPCRKPGLFDRMVEFYMTKVDNPDWTPGPACVMAGSKSDYWFGHMDKSGRVQPAQQEGVAYNVHPTRYQTMMNHHISASWWWIPTQILAFSRALESAALYPPWIYEIEPWEDTHIDKESDWEAAEYYLKTKILDVYGEDCYERYRDTWRGKV